jgi:hypothetical protein
VRANGVEQRACSGVGVIALGNGILPCLRGTLGLFRSRRSGEHFVNLRGGVIQQLLVHFGSSLVSHNYLLVGIPSPQKLGEENGPRIP